LWVGMEELGLSSSPRGSIAGGVQCVQGHLLRASNKFIPTCVCVCVCVCLCVWISVIPMCMREHSWSTFPPAVHLRYACVCACVWVGGLVVWMCVLCSVFGVCVCVFVCVCVGGWVGCVDVCVV